MGRVSNRGMPASDIVKAFASGFAEKARRLLGDDRLRWLLRTIPQLAGEWLIRSPGASPAEEPKATLFDADYYSARYSDAGRNGMPALRHYLLFGARKGYQPHPLFDPAFYLEQNPDLAGSHLNPLIHFNLYGFRELRSPGPLFDLRHYCGEHAEASVPGVNAVNHFLSKGLREGAFPNALFDPAFYGREYQGSISGTSDPLSNYAVEGVRNGRRPNPVFDPEYYLNRYPELRERGVDPLWHYLTAGGFQQCDPSPLFDSSYYLAQNPEVAALRVNPLVHYLYQGGWRNSDPHPLFDTSFYLRHGPETADRTAPLVDFLRGGWQAGRMPNPLFHTNFYIARNPGCGNPLIHFVERGAAQGRMPNPLFDPAYYLERYPEAAGWNPLDHYIRKGAHCGYNPSPEFDSAYYLSQNPDVAASGINPLAHYLWVGRNQGRLPAPPPSAPGISGRTCRRIEPLSSQAQKISVILPVYNSRPRYLRSAIESVWRQSYGNWELCVVEDGSASAGLPGLLEEVTHCDPRARTRFHAGNRGVSAASNAALRMATGGYVLFLDHDDELSPDAMQEVAVLLGENPGADAVYSDAASTDADGTVRWTYHKPDWSPDFFMGVMYVGHLLVVRRDLALEIGGFDSRFDGVQDYEFMLRYAERSRKIAHIRKCLYEWRRTGETMTAGARDGSWFHALHRSAVNEHLKRRKIPGKAAAVIRPGPYVTLSPRQRSQWPTVTLLWEEGFPDERLTTFLTEDYAPGKIETGTRDSFISPGYVLVCGSVFGVESREFLQHLLLHAGQSDVACVSPLILRPDGLVHNAGVSCELGFRYLFAGWSRHYTGYAGELCSAREVALVSGHCYLVRSDVFREIDGGGGRFLTGIGRGIDASMRAHIMGYRNIVTPAAALTCARPLTPDGRCSRDVSRLEQEWEEQLTGTDPFSHAGFRHASHIRVLEEPGVRRIEGFLRA